MSAKNRQRLSITLRVFALLLICTSPVWAAPVALDNDDLKNVTAGTSDNSVGGGFVIANSSAVSIEQHTRVEIGDEVQSEATGLNLVNSTTSAVANTVNVWNGSDFSAAWEVNQINHIEQDQARSASLQGYQRPEAESIVYTSSENFESHDTQTSSTHDVTDLFQEERITTNNSTSNVDTGIHFNAGDQLDLDANIGNGIAAAGQLDVHYDSGEAQFAMTAGGGVSANAGIGNDLAGIEVGVGAEAKLALLATINLPELDISVNGGGCGVLMGSCDAEGSTYEKITTILDHSYLDIEDAHTVNTASLSQSSSQIHRSPFYLDNAQADYIVVDDATLVLDTEESLVLEDGTQRKLKAMNVVNAVGSTVANAVNVAHNAQIDPCGRLSLYQTNFVYHGH